MLGLISAREKTFFPSKAQRYSSTVQHNWLTRLAVFYEKHVTINVRSLATWSHWAGRVLQIRTAYMPLGTMAYWLITPKNNITTPPKKQRAASSAV
jgi:hypothetical protein